MRKKRTYVKRDAEELAGEVAVEEETAVAEAQAALEAEQVAAAQAGVEAPVEEVVVVPPVEEEETPEDLANLDPEILRQRAHKEAQLKDAALAMADKLKEVLYIF